MRPCYMKLLTTSVLLTLGIMLTIITLATNLFLALSLPKASSPGWVKLRNASAHSMPEAAVAFHDSDPEILHVVTSRFMQLQPDLLALGKARLHLFETFCLPSMLQQETDNFVWFVMTEPNLEKTLLERMRSLLAPHSNFYLVLMNDKLVTPEILTKSIEDQLILTGDVDRLRSIMFDNNRPLLLETRLDADDALSRKTLRIIQQAARSLPYDNGGWQVICNNLHYEWRNKEITASTETVQTSGQLRLVMESMCITAGYTLVCHRRQGSIDFPPWPRIGHHMISREWPKCFGRRNVTKDCWIRLPKYPAALRSRTATSAGMSRVEATAKDSPYDNQTDALWPYVELDFGILPEEAKATSSYLKSHLQEIVADNIKGQCTFGHSCKKSSKDKLESILAKSSNQTSVANSLQAT